MLRDAIARRLEEGAFDGRVASLASRAWTGVTSSRLARPLRVPDEVQVIAVGGATLGGSWKTPLAIACTKELARTGMKVGLVGHAYGARPGYARFVRIDDDVRAVGDEALAAARELSGMENVRVAVGPTRQQAFDFARTHAERIVIDGALQLAPRRASLALLALDALKPWGSGACPPRGDLRAPTAALAKAADALVAIGPDDGLDPSLAELGIPMHRARAVLPAVRLQGQALSWAEVRQTRIGLWTAVARPERVEATLASMGVRPCVVLRGADHAGPSAHALERAKVANVDLWLATKKCAEHLQASFAGRPLATIDLFLELPPALVSALVYQAARQAAGEAVAEGSGSTIPYRGLESPPGAAP